MLRSRRRIEHHVSNVVTREWFDSVIDVVRPLLVAMETDNTEIGLHESRLDVGDPDSRLSNINSQSIGNGLDSRLGSTIHITSCVSCITSH